MKYNDREVADLSVLVKLGEDCMDKFKENQMYVADILRKNKVKGWSYTEAIMDDIVSIACIENSLEAINNLFSNVKKLFNNSNIGVFYDDFGDYDYNEEEFSDCLDANLVYA